MDSNQFLKACQLRDAGKFDQAVEQFRKVATGTKDPVDKAGVLINIAATLRALSQFDAAREELRIARHLVESSDEMSVEQLACDPRLLQLKLGLEFEEADICGYEGKLNAALTKFNLLLNRYQRILKYPEFRDSYEMIQTRRGFLFVDLDRCKEALPILEEAEFFEGRKAEIYFYLGHCYLSNCEYDKAAKKLLNALKLSLPRILAYRAHCELGIAYYRLKGFAEAKLEFERSAETADPEYIHQAQIWKWLANTSRTLGLKDEADRYAKLAVSS